MNFKAFYNESKVSLQNIFKQKQTSKMPKVKNTKKTGEILSETEKFGDEVKTFLRKRV